MPSLTLGDKTRRTSTVVVALLGCLLIATAYSVTLFGGYSALSDGNDYAGLARSLARGNGYTLGNVYPLALAFSPAVPQRNNVWAPGYPAYLSLWFATCGANDRTALTGGIAALWILVTAAYFLGQQTGGRALGLFAAGVLALNQGLLRIVIGGSSEALAGGLLTLAVVPLLRPANASRVVVSAMLCGLALLTRYQLVVAILPLGSCFLARRPRMLGLWLTVVCLTVSPWLVRNMTQLGSAVMTLQLYGEFTKGMSRFPDEYFTYRSLTPMPIGFVVVHFPVDLLRKFWVGLLYFLQSFPLSVNLVGVVPFLAATLMARRLKPLEQSIVTFTNLSLVSMIALSSVGGHHERHLLPLQAFVTLTTLLGVSVLIDRVPVGWRRLALLLAAIGLVLPVRAPDQERVLLTIARGGLDRRAQFAALAAATDAKAVIVSDVSDAVWWYADRSAIWIPVRDADVVEVINRSGADHLYLAAPVDLPSVLSARVVGVETFAGPGRLYRIRP